MLGEESAFDWLLKGSMEAGVALATPVHHLGLLRLRPVSHLGWLG
jgi:hypothetical protein